MWILLLSCLFEVYTMVFAQGTLYIEGKIFDKETKEPLSAYVTIDETDIGCTADKNGYFKLDIGLLESDKIKENEVSLTIWVIGYKKANIPVKIGEFVTIPLKLEPFLSYEVEVTADSIVSDEKSKKTVTMSKMDVYTIPGTAADPVTASRILPGVNAMPDSSSILIRGGAPDEVTYFFDGIEVEHPFLSESLHESYFSIFDNQYVESFNVSTSGFHSKYGDALSGVMDITAKDSIFRNEGGVGLSIMGLNSYAGLTMNHHGSFLGSYNRGHSYLLTRINNRKNSSFQTENGLAKINLNVNNFNSFRVVALYNKYEFSHEDGFRTDSRNNIFGVSFTSVLGENILTELAISRVTYHATYQVENEFQKDIKDNVYQARLNTTLDLNRHFLEFGADFQNRKIEVSFSNPDKNREKNYARGNRWGLYFYDKFRISDQLFINVGARISSLDLLSNHIILDPRASVAYFIRRNDILRFSAGIYHQYGDYFTIKNNNSLKPKAAHHYSISYDRITENTNMRITAYNKEYRNLFLNMNDGATNNNGLGFARGAEFFIKKRQKKYEMIFVYNFLHSKRKENDVSTLIRSPYEIDHSLTGIFKYEFNNASLGFRYSYASGVPYTPLIDAEPDSQAQTVIPLWGEPYSERYPYFQRVDINGSRNFHYRNRLIVLYFGITNVLNKKNILRYEYDDDYSTRKNIYSIFGRSVFIGVYFPFF